MRWSEVGVASYLGYGVSVSKAANVVKAFRNFLITLFGLRSSEDFSGILQTLLLHS